MKYFFLLLIIPFLTLALDTKSTSLPENTFEDENNKIEIFRTIAKIYYQTKDYDSALLTYDKLLKLKPNDEEAQYMKGVIYITSKNYQKAIDHLEHKIEINPNSYHGLNNLACSRSLK